MNVVIPKRAARIVRLLLACLMAFPSLALAQNGKPDLSQMSIEDLMNIQMTSASRKEQRAFDVAAAVFVITHDDIVRSGMSSVPELLRLAPGVDVARFNSNKWAISVRGFNGLYSNKLLILVDGRSVYSRIFSGVLWDAEDLMVDDIDRIEVIRGPGAALWGANAVNGVINIVTKPAADTQGLLVRAEGGRVGEQAAIRYGGVAGATRYRLYSQWTGRNEFLLPSGGNAHDESYSITSGFRADWSASPGAFLLEGNVTVGQTRPLWFNLNNPQNFAREPIDHEPSDGQGGHLFGRWTRSGSGGSSLQVQSFVDIGGRQEAVGDYNRRIFDIDTQYHRPLGTRHDLVAGAGYRFIAERLEGTFGFSLDPAEGQSSLLTAFAQDEIQFFNNRLALTVGSQVQYDSDSGAGAQPTARLMWKPNAHHRVWTATSRALRTPSLAETGLRLVNPPTTIPNVPLPAVFTVLGNPDLKTESLVDFEAGYRVELGSTASVDVTGFVGKYDDLVTRELNRIPTIKFTPFPQAVFTVPYDNLLEATTKGLEIAGHWSPIPLWRLDGSYTAFRVTPKLSPLSTDQSAGTDDGSAPKSQWQLRSAFKLGTRGTLDVGLFHVGRLEQFKVDAYTRADITAEWSLTSRLSAMVIGQNLLESEHAEFSNRVAPLGYTHVPRSVSLRLRWTVR